jgi:hypothetical protein
MSEQKIYNASLSRVVKGSLGRTRLAFCITKDEDGVFDCFLSTLEISGTVIADGLEVQLALQNQASNGSQAWRLERPENVVADDKNGDEIEILVQDIVLKIGNGQAMAMAVFGRQGEHVVTTENWY